MALFDSDTLVDVGAGWTEFDHLLRTEYNWCGRYIPVDGGIDGTNLDLWDPPRQAEWFVAMEILEHLESPYRLLHELQQNATKGVIITTPNPDTTDVLAMDETHVTPIHREHLGAYGFEVSVRSFFGQRDDSLLATWYRS